MWPHTCAGHRGLHKSSSHVGARKFFPPQVVRSEPRPSQTEEVRACVKDMWQAYHAMKRVALEYPTQHIPVKFRPITFHLTSQTTLNTSECLEATSQMATMWQEEKSLLLRSFKALHLFATSYKQKVLRQRGQEKRQAKVTSILDAAQPQQQEICTNFIRRFVNYPPKTPRKGFKLGVQIIGPSAEPVNMQRLCNTSAVFSPGVRLPTPRPGLHLTCRFPLRK